MVRGYIDPDTHQCYQAVIHVGNTPPEPLPPAGDCWEWAGVRLLHATLDRIPDTSHCFVAVAVLESMNRDALAKVPHALHKLKARGTLLGAVITAGAAQAATLYRLWQDYSDSLAEPIHGEGALPMIVGVDSHADMLAVLRWFNMYTYAPMMICSDWFDIRSMGNQGHPVRHHRIIADDYPSALDRFARQLEGAGPAVMMSLVESPTHMRMESINDIVDLVYRSRGEEQLADVITCILADRDDRTTELHWWELLNDQASRPGELPPPD